MLEKADIEWLSLFCMGLIPVCISLSDELTAAYGKEYTPRALRQYRQFYITFLDIEKWNTRVPFLTWSHLRSLLRVTNPAAREWYLQEAANQGWGVRTLKRNINSQYYERLLLSQNKEPVEAEMKEITASYQSNRLEFIKNPVVAEFLGLSSNIDFTETELEQSIITR